jgi:predicted amidophosphoribosyltransferase
MDLAFAAVHTLMPLSLLTFWLASAGWTLRDARLRYDEPEFRCCPGCGDDLRTECDRCEAVVRIGWTACPHCLAPVGAESVERAA